MSTFRPRNTQARKLTAMQVMQIRERYAQGETQGSLARAFAMSIVQIGRIVRGEAWTEQGGRVLLTDQQHEANAAAYHMRVHGGSPPPASADEIQRSLERVQQLIAEGEAEDEDHSERTEQIEQPNETGRVRLLERMESDIQQVLNTKTPAQKRAERLVQELNELSEPNDNGNDK